MSVSDMKEFLTENNELRFIQVVRFVENEMFGGLHPFYDHNIMRDILYFSLFDKDEHTPENCILQGKSKVFEFLMQAKKIPVEQVSSLIVLAIKHDRGEILANIIGKKVRAGLVFFLISSCEHDSVKCLEFLIKNREISRPLVERFLGVCVRNDSAKCFKLIFESRARYEEDLLERSFGYSIQEGAENIFSYLSEIDEIWRNRTLSECLDAAILWGQEKIVRMLLKMGVEVGRRHIVAAETFEEDNILVVLKSKY